MDISIKDEVYNDFKESLDKIDFSSYNPLSTEFVSTLYVGLMWNLLCEIGEDKSIEVSDSQDEIREELDGAKKYMNTYMDTKDEAYKEMASDELKHASILIKKAMTTTINNGDRVRLKNYDNELKELEEKIKVV